MEVLAAGAAWALSSTCDNMPTAQQWFGGICPQPRVDVEELAARLSPQAEIILPESGSFESATKRWSTDREMGISVVVVASTTQDVAQTVKYANEVRKPFQAYSSGHGAVTTLGKMKGGIQISLGNFDQIKISDDKATATVGAGVISRSLTDALWKERKQTVTGSCECVSVIGPGLGGGHGIMQGRHGLIQDQFVSFEMVQADGSIHIINETSDLWWGMRGAGQNFGIVTSAEMKIHDVNHENWAFETFIFSGASVEGLYEAINDHVMAEGQPPADVITFSVFGTMPEIDPDNSLISFLVMQEGAKSVDPKWSKPFLNLDPILHQSGTGLYPDLASWVQADLESDNCKKTGAVNIRFPIDLPAFNPRAQREVFDLFNKVTHENPALNRSAILQEGYSLEGMKRIPDESSAYPWRGDNIVILPVVNYFEHIHEKAAEEFGEALRAAFWKGTGREELHSYVNYAYGNENLESVYGYESWRLEKLRALKKKYDPHGRFDFNMPIV